MTDVDSVVDSPDTAPPADDIQQQQQQQPQPLKQFEEEKVAQEEEVLSAGIKDGNIATMTGDAMEEQHKEPTQSPVEHRKEEVKEQAADEQQPLQPPEPDIPATHTSSDNPHLTYSAQPSASDDSDSDSDNDNASEQATTANTAAASTPPVSTTLAPRPKAVRASILEQQIEQEDKHDREYHVPHLADFDFSTPTPSEPATPSAPATAPAPAPFRFDPSIILLPDTERFCAASLPLLYPKLALTLAGADVNVDVKLSALVCCVELLRSPLHVYELQAHGVLDELIVNAGAGDERLRVLATEALTWAVRAREARHYCRENGIVGRMGTLLIDHCVTVRINAANVLLRLSASEPQLLYEPPVSAAAGDAASVMAYLVRRVQKDNSDAVKALLLRCILCGLTRREGLIVARYNTLLPVLASLLPISHPPLIAAACDCVAAVAVDEVDRHELLSLRLHSALLEWLVLGDVAVRRAAAGALMQATVGVAVKQAVVAAGGVQVCAQRVKSDESVETVLCVLLELLANLLHSKAGKQLVVGDDALLTAVRSRAEDKTASSNLHLSAQSALQKLTYAP